MAGRDSHVRPIQQKNGGLSAARTLNGSCENFVPAQKSTYFCKKDKKVSDTGREGGGEDRVSR